MIRLIKILRQGREANKKTASFEGGGFYNVVILDYSETTSKSTSTSCPLPKSILAL